MITIEVVDGIAVLEEHLGTFHTDHLNTNPTGQLPKGSRPSRFWTDWSGGAKRRSGGSEAEEQRERSGGAEGGKNRDFGAANPSGAKRRAI
ncbi:non-ribosomal peptide synthetase [Nocardia seriolae]|uniref:Non-ribosomal peptide synthetase n=1 Tax=Nocardia seriolae TaxID=37332 RepID=A0ABC9YN95_9NOCA|nr:peptide synthetase [Nocardia seriolae]GAP26890.1 non-ribosomal peptide synthetase [Nocardia seriolae]